MNFAALALYLVSILVTLVSIIIGIRLIVVSDKKLKFSLMFLLFAIGFFALYLVGEIIGSEKIFGPGDFFVSLNQFIIILFIFISLLIFNALTREIIRKRK